MIRQTHIDAAIDMVRARHMDDVALVAIADAIGTAVSEAGGALGRQRAIQAGQYAYPHAEVSAMLEVARTQAKLLALYDVLAVALQRMGETVERG